MSPTLKRFARCKITVYADDHGAPHFHVAGPGFRLVVEIGSLRVLRGVARREDVAEALAWAAENAALLLAEWEKLNRRIEP